MPSKHSEKATRRGISTMEDNLSEKIEKLIKESKQEIEERKNSLEKEIGEFEIAEKKAAEKGFPGETSRHLELLKYYRDLNERLEKVQKGLEIEPDEVEKHKEKAHQKKQEYTEKDAEDLMYLYDDACRIIKASINMSTGKDFENLSAGKKDTFPTMENFNSIEEIAEKEELKEFREKNTHQLLASAELLRNRKESLKGLEFLTEDDIEKVDEFSEKLDEISKELTKRASKLDNFLLRASVKLNKAEKREENYS